MSLADAALAMRGVLHGADASFSAVTTDSRRVSAGSLFFALSGVHHDGHEYVQAARAAGAVAAVVCREEAAAGGPSIVVDDVQLALGRLAHTWRMQLPVTVVAITGNSGKTTTKELTAAVLRTAAPTLATPGNYNNEIGMPLTLLQLDEDHRYAVIEMGQGQPGDIAYLARIARPSVALVTNVTGAHLGGFGSMEAIAAGKAEVYASLDSDGVAIVNLDDRFSGYWLDCLPACGRVTFGTAAAADVRAEAISVGDDGCARFELVSGGARVAVALGIPGIHNVSNALAAVAVGTVCGIPAEDIAKALATVRPVGGRMAVRELSGGIRLVDDTYNANPGSVRAAVDTLCAWRGRRVLVLGEMAELGAAAAELHREIGEYACRKGVDALFVTGSHASDVVAGFGDRASAFATVDELVKALQAEVAEGVTILVKGSRSARMERVVAAITGEQDAALAH